MLRSLCTQRGLSYGDVARATGISFPTVTLAARAVPGPATRAKLALYFGTAEDELFPFVEFKRAS